MEPTVKKDRNSNIIYSALWITSLAAAGSFVSTCIIRNPGRFMQIKSIFIDLASRYTVTGLPIIWDNNVSQVFQVRLYHPTNEKITRMFIPTGGTGPVNNGDELRFTQPGQTIFSSFFIANDLEISIGITNLEAALNTTHILTIAIETEEHRIS